MSDPIGLRVLGDDRALALAGPDGPAAGGPTVHLGPATVSADVIWLSGPAPAGWSGGARLIATAGEGLWGQAPWPARDALFELPAPPAALILVAGGSEEHRAEVAGKLADRGLPVSTAAELSVEDLAAASVVALLGDAGAATPEAPWAATAMPAEAPAVLAARRVLIAPRSGTTFGLHAGSDHLAFGTADDIVQYADTILTFPRSFEPFSVLGAVAARPFRASRVYARLADELRSAPRSSAPAG
jgi:hypothetical protein